LETPEPLKKLMASLDGVSQLVTKGEKNISYDYCCPLLSLPLAFNTDLSSIPIANKYIAFDNASTRILEWEERLGVSTRPRIGLAWSGNPGHQNDASRSLPLEQLLSHLPKKYEYISLQKEVREEDRLILESSPDISSFESSLSDFSDTAALIECMDLVITVDTSVAHLSGALGKKTWLLLPHSPDWRWLLDRSDSPWYPSMKLYRQSISQDWGEVLDKVKSDLLALT
jgi:ADP-heptose:LPS heptosyltransferase